MTPQERHSKIKELFHATVDMLPIERSIYLAQACQGDVSLQQEVEALLVEDENEQFSGALRAKISQQAEEVLREGGNTMLIGKIVNQRYLIEKELGQGAIGVVYLARDEQVHGRQVVLKTLLADSDANPWLQQKFRHESEALARIDHPGVVKVLDIGELPSGKPFFVMEYVKGETLQSVMQPEGTNLELVAHIVRQMGQALGAAHDEGVVHRDLKPGNIMLHSLSGNVKQTKLVDFGIAKVKDPKTGGSTGGPMTAGTILYMAPEQMRDGEASPQSDIYSFGVLAYELVTGRRPFVAEVADTPAVMWQLLKLQEAGVKAKPKDLRAKLPEAGQAAILKALSFRPQDRYQRAWEFGEDLANALLSATGSHNTIHATESIVIEINPEDREANAQEAILAVAHILFTDIVGYSKLPATEQVNVIQNLQKIVQGSAIYRKAQTQNKLISLPTGDGMALAFFTDPATPVRCSLEIARALQATPQIKLRMGVHSGPVYVVKDINGNRNVSGGGINIAQRVMDCGDAGHILLSKSTAEMITQLGIWPPEYFTDLGEYTVKHGVKVHLVNLATPELGNVTVPNKPKVKSDAELPLTKPAKSPSEDTLPQSPPLVIQVTPNPHLRGNLFKYVVPSILVVVLMMGGYFVLKPILQSDNGVIPLVPKMERQLTFSALVQKFKKGTDGNPVPYGDQLSMYGDLSGSIYFQKDDGIRLLVNSPQSGYLYLLNEGPKSGDDGKPKYTILFPSTMDNNSSASLAANSRIQIPNNDWLGFFGSVGTEKVWLVWSDKAVSELEAVIGLNNPKDKGLILKPDQIDAIQQVLNAKRPKLEIQNDEKTKETHLRGEGETMVYVVTLVHR